MRASSISLLVLVLPPLLTAEPSRDICRQPLHIEAVADLLRSLSAPDAVPVRVTVISRGDTEIEETMETLSIVRRMPATILDAPFSVKRRCRTRRPRCPRTDDVYIRGPNFEWLHDFMYAGHVASACHAYDDKAPLVLHIRGAIYKSPPRFGLSHPSRLDYVFSELDAMAVPLAGTSAPNSAYHRAVTVHLQHSVKVATGLPHRPASPQLLDALANFDALGVYTLRLIAECLRRWMSITDTIPPDHVEHALKRLDRARARPSMLQDKCILSVFYEPGGCLEGHVDSSKVGTLVTTNTANPDGLPLLELAPGHIAEDVTTVAYDRGDLVFFPANVWHRTRPFPRARQILNLFL